VLDIAHGVIEVDWWRRWRLDSGRRGVEMKAAASPGKGRGFRWSYIIAFALVLISFFVFSHITAQRDTASLSYTEFKKMLEKGDLAKVVFKGNSLQGTFREPVELKRRGKTVSFTNFTSRKPDVQDPELMGLLEKHDVVISAEPKGGSWFSTLLLMTLPWLLIVGLFAYSGRKLQQRMGGMGRGGGLFGFGRSKAKLYRRSESQATFDDVAGLPNAKKELAEIVGFLKDPKRYRTLGGKLPKGILLIGPPGTGKTLLARAVAGEAEVRFYSISGSEFIEMFVGVGASRVRDMFANAKKEAPAIIFIDELDSIGRVRGTGLGGGHDEREQTLNQILAEMDGFSPHESVVVIAATNRPDVLDPALVRPGRFDRQITMERPQRKAREDILRIHSRGVPLADGVDLGAVARRTVGFSGADLRNLVNEAALLAGRKGKKQVEDEDFDLAIDKIRLGIEREDFLTDDEKKLVAYHEAGHALTAYFLPGADPLAKVTIIPRGRALGATEQLPEEERHNLSRSYLMDRVAVMLGGRAAEGLVFHDITSGAAEDLKQASRLARQMVCQLGMSEKLGPVTFRQGETHPFLGREIAAQRDFSEETARLIDVEVRRIVEEGLKTAGALLESHREDLDKLAAELLEHETLGREEVQQLLQGDGSPRREAGGGNGSGGEGLEEERRRATGSLIPRDGGNAPVAGRGKDQTMLRSLNSIIGYRLRALDGEMGRCRDFLVDDRYWLVRYVVAQTGTWISGRNVLVSPLLLQEPAPGVRRLTVGLTGEQVEKAPPLQDDAPVSWRYERRWFARHRLPFYWAGSGIWGSPPAPPGLPGGEEAKRSEKKMDPEGTSLRSVKEVTGYRIRAADGRIGRVDDFVVDQRNWGVRHLVVDTRPWVPGRKVLVTPSLVRRVDWAARIVAVDLTTEAVRKSRRYDPFEPVNRTSEGVPCDYLGRPVSEK
jgi:cell division protease FtsH